MTRFFKMVLLFAGITMPATAQAAAIYIADHNTTFNQTFEMINDSTNTYRFVITATFDPSGPITAPNGAPSGFETIDAVAFQINDTPDFTTRIPIVYEPTAMNPAWPKLKIPVVPMFSWIPSANTP